MQKTAWLAGALFLVACNGNTTSESGVGTRYDVTETGIVEAALDDGAVAVDTPSPDWLEVRVGKQRNFIPRGSTAPDLSSYHFGRAELAYPTRTTPVSVELTGLDWHTGDSLQLVAPNAGLSIHELEHTLRYPANQAQGISGQQLDWSTMGSPLVESKKGDTTYIAQMTSMPASSGGAYSVVTRAGVAPSFTTTDGQDSMLAAALAPVALDKKVAFHWRGDAFAALASEAGTGARPAAAPALSIRTLPDPMMKNNRFFSRYYMYLPSLVDFGPVTGDGEYRQDIAYGNPFAKGKTRWSEFVSVVYAMPVTIPGVGATTAMVVQATPIDALVDGAVEPAISPVRNVKVNGKPAGAAVTGAGAAPTITWDAPRVGAATNYSVSVQHAVPAVNGMKLETVGTFMTTSTQLALPAFATSDYYVLTITAIASPGHELGAKPFLGGVPYASADYITSTITP